MRRAQVIGAAIGVCLGIGTSGAAALPMTYIFTGEVEYDASGGPAVPVPPGRMVSGTLTIDPGAFTSSTSDGATTVRSFGYYCGPSALECPLGFPSITDPPQVSGSLVDGASTIEVGSGTEADQAYAGVNRGAGGTFNQFQVSGSSTGVGLDAYVVERTIGLRVYDRLGASSGIFTDPTGGLSLTQPIDWFASGATATFWAYERSGPYPGYRSYIGGRLTSMTTVVGRVPEPAPLALLLIGTIAALGGAFGRRGRCHVHLREAPGSSAPS